MMEKESSVGMRVVVCVLIYVGLFLRFTLNVNAQGLQNTTKTDSSVDMQFAGGDGASMEKAVIIKYIGDYQQSIEQEYKYLEMKFGKEEKYWKKLKVSLIETKDKSYDEMVIQLLPSLEEKTIYFDITEPFYILLKELQQKE